MGLMQVLKGNIGAATEIWTPESRIQHSKLGVKF